MGTQTPPPVGRAHTPPAPLHGPMFDSPRRSSRIHNKQRASPSNHMDSPKAVSSRKRISTYRTSQQALSPPSSPTSPDHRTQLSQTKKSKPAVRFGPDAHGSSHRQQRSTNDLAPTMYPTPAKTPRKRAPPSDLGNTARVLFHDIETDPEQIMPTPSKSRKGKKHAALSLESFEGERNDGSKVQIYTDSKERMPEMDESEDNPFIVRKKDKNTTSENPSTTGRGRRKAKHGMSKKVDEAVENNEGIVYTFRGKKIFRRFSDNVKGGESEGNEEPDSSLSNEKMLQRQAGPEGFKRLTRSSVKPRILFPPKGRGRSVERDVDDEEATTDIESPRAGEAQDEATNTDQRKESERLISPATSGEKQKPSPFDSWPRTKAGVKSGAKRPGSPMEKAGRSSEKRSRSAHPIMHT